MNKLFFGHVHDIKNVRDYKLLFKKIFQPLSLMFRTADII